jgi:chaperonin GroEL
MTAATDSAENAALRVVADSLEAPFRALLENCGYEAAPTLADLEGTCVDVGFDALRGRVTHLPEAGIVDPAGVVSAAVAGAIRSAALALTIDATVLTRKADVSVDPE